MLDHLIIVSQILTNLGQQMRLRERDMNHKITKTAAIELEHNCEFLHEAEKRHELKHTAFIF